MKVNRNESPLLAFFYLKQKILIRPSDLPDVLSIRHTDRYTRESPLNILFKKTAYTVFVFAKFFSTITHHRSVFNLNIILCKTVPCFICLFKFECVVLITVYKYILKVMKCNFNLKGNTNVIIGK